MSEPEADLHVVVLAAGASRRFGSPKQLVRVDGRPMLHTVVSNAASLGGHAVSVVLGSGASELAPLLRHTPATVVVNRNWEEGMGSSLRAAMTRLPGAPAAVLVMLADQIAVTVEDLRRLVAAWRRNPEAIATATYGGTMGVPAVFPRRCFAALGGLRGDQGARLLIQREWDTLVRVPMPNAAIDIDVPEDLLEVEARRRRSSGPTA
ncbi:MAG: nucleotidyltransferase family protein [Proteobacteria bacterium]|nr:MAG: nucleotidyltransferase family protein [Pseudomonadota bacterium]